MPPKTSDGAQQDLALGIAVVIATFAGPTAAVYVTRHIDRTRGNRRMDVFRTLMQTRRAVLSPDHVGALNMVEIEFHGVPGVLSAFQELLRYLNTKPPLPADWQDKRSKIQTRLLSAMANTLGYKMEQLDVLEGGYLPQGWLTQEEELQQFKKVLFAAFASLPLNTSSSTMAPPSAPDGPRPPTR